MGPVMYLSQGKFHRSIHCDRTGCKVTYGLIGDWSEKYHFYYPRKITKDGSDRPIILYILPSGCSRYVGIFLDRVASLKGVRIVAIDRPGAGGTPMCSGPDRLSISRKQTISVLEALEYGNGKSKIHVLTHSAGWFYALDLLTERPDLFTKETRIVFTSPFIPTHRSGNLVLSMLPRSVIQLAPTGMSILKFGGNAISWSSGISQSLGIRSMANWKNKSSIEEERRKNQIRQKSKVRLPTAQFHPPYDLNTALEKAAWQDDQGSSSTSRKASGNSNLHPKTQRPLKTAANLLFEYLEIEGVVRAATEDFLFCLGKVEGVTNEKLDTWTQEKMLQLAKQEDGIANLLIVWAEKDFLIPTKGQLYFDTLLSQAGLEAEKWMMADAGHDDVLASQQVSEAIIDSFTRQQ